MTTEQKVEIALRGYPFILRNNSGSIMVVQFTPAPKAGIDKYRLHYSPFGADNWQSVLYTKEAISTEMGRCEIIDYFDMPKKKMGKQKCRCDIMLLMAKGCQCGGV